LHENALCLHKNFKNFLKNYANFWIRHCLQMTAVRIEPQPESYESTPTTYASVFQLFCCRGTLHKREGHSRNPMRIDPWVQRRRLREAEAMDSFP